MGLDIYVGSYTRYYTGNWETVVQQYARESGMKVEIVRPQTDEETDEMVTDPDQIREAVVGWRDGLSASLGDNIKSPLDWDESDDAPYFTDKPAWDGYSSLVMWAAYSEHPELERPAASTEDWSSDPAFQRSTGPDFKTVYPTLLKDIGTWLPVEFSFNFKGVDVAGDEMMFGSAYALRDELYHLNKTTWNVDDQTLSQWRRDGADHGGPLETAARFAFAVFWELTNSAIKHRLIMKLDY